MTAVRPPAGPPRPGLLRRGVSALSPAQLALTRYQLTPAQKAEMYARGTALSQIAVPIGSAVYYLLIQRAYGFHDPDGPWNTVWWGKDFYDRFPVHARNGLPGILAVLAGLAAAGLTALILMGPVLRVRDHPKLYAAVTAATALAAGTAAGLLTARQLTGWHVHWFPGQSAPPWFVAARHQFRHFLIGAIAAVMVSSITIGLGKRVRKRVPNWAIPVRFAVAFAAATPVAAAFIALFAWVLPHLLHWDAARMGLAVGSGNGQVIAAAAVAAAGAALATGLCLWRKAPAPLIPLAAAVTGAGLYAAVAYLMPRYGMSAAPFGRGVGTLAGQWIGKGAWEATLTGVVTGLAMKLILRPAQDTLQLISIENKMHDHQEAGPDGTVSYAAPARWWRIVYGSNYVNRYRYCVEQGHHAQRHGLVMGFVMAVSSPLGLFLLGFGIWLLWGGGPATGVH